MTLSDPFEFLNHLVTVGDCWEWRGDLDDKGYGRLVVRGVSIRAHRYSYALHHGDIPAGAYICHHCDNRRCVNPDHLYAGTPATNTADMIRRGRHNTGERPRGEANGAAHATAETVASIRAEHAAGATQASLAAKFGISRTQVHRIVHRKHWQHVA